MSEILTVIASVSLLVFILGSMLAMGFSLTVNQIVAPLRNTRLVSLSLAANFVLVPLFALLILLVIPLEDDLATGLIILAVAAGAPFLPKLAEAAKGNMGFSVGLMTLLMVVTAIYMPIVLPLLLPEATISAWDIAKPLIVLMLLPLGVAMFIKARYETFAQTLQPHMSQASTIGLLFMFVAVLILQWSNIVSLIGTGGIGAIAVFLVGAFLIGYLLGGPGQDTKSVLGVGTGQRNLSAALLVAGGSFAGEPNVLVFVLVTAVVGLLIIGGISGELGKRVQTGQKEEEEAEEEPAAAA